MKISIKFFSKILFVFLERLTHRRVWSLAVFDKDTGTRKVLQNPPGVGRADPFPIIEGEEIYVFFEELFLILR